MSSEDRDEKSDASMVSADSQASDFQSALPEAESRLRREVAKYREQALSAQAERDAAIASMRAETDARLIRSELRTAAVKSGIIDIDALKLVDLTGLTVQADGNIEGADDAIASLKTTKPYLFEDTRASVYSTFTTSQPRRPPTPAQPDVVDARTLSREQWQVERSKFLSRSR